MDDGDGWGEAGNGMGDEAADGAVPPRRIKRPETICTFFSGLSESPVPISIPRPRVPFVVYRNDEQRRPLGLFRAAKGAGGR